MSLEGAFRTGGGGRKRYSEKVEIPALFQLQRKKCCTLLRDRHLMLWETPFIINSSTGVVGESWSNKCLIVFISIYVKWVNIILIFRFYQFYINIVFKVIIKRFWNYTNFILLDIIRLLTDKPHDVLSKPRFLQPFFIQKFGSTVKFFGNTDNSIFQ